MFISLALVATSCVGIRIDETDVFKYCELEGSKKYTRDPIIISFEGGRWVRSDTAGNIKLVETTEAVGIIEPFPISLPRVKEIPVDGMSWEIGGYLFTARFTPGDQAKIKIESSSLNEESPGVQSSVGYSPHGGIEYFEFLDESQDGSREPVRWVNCGREGIRFTDMIINPNGNKLLH